MAGAGWDAVLRATVENAPHHFIRYWTLDAGALMRLAGDGRRCSSYLMGNHTIAERMYRHDPAIMLYAPLRTAIHQDADGGAWFSVDQPSTGFGSSGDHAITDVGFELDHKLAALLEHLGVPVPPRWRDEPEQGRGGRRVTTLRPTTADLLRQVAAPKHTDGYAENGDIRISYRAHGAGRPILFLHGFPTLGSPSLTRSARPFRARARRRGWTRLGRRRAPSRSRSLTLIAVEGLIVLNSSILGPLIDLVNRDPEQQKQRGRVLAEAVVPYRGPGGRREGPFDWWGRWAWRP
jgi:hypothetical protein